jgi:hypothetical protein
MASGSRRRLARTFSRGRWREYERLLSEAGRRDYQILPLEDWVRGDGDPSRRTLVMRHDVDQCPPAALTMARIEERHGITSTWYVRWRTADPRVVDALRAAGGGVGLHYETLSRTLIESGTPASEMARLVEHCRARLAEEVALFVRRHGPISSVCPHGDSRVPGADNGLLMRDQDPTRFGVEFDGNEAMRGRRLAYWLTDRSAADGGWRDRVDPRSLLERGATPILCLTHPNNWVSGAGLWRDRLLSLAVPDAAVRPSRTRSDAPPD